ncbi:MAG: hypothetical protein EP332_01990 [Bacteroidetes bacterium]|nr:MAG: hypothetical protein EP332_01990 [Bacteroidota bacterium]
MKQLPKSKFNSLNKKDLKENAINSLRDSFAFEGFEFSDTEIAEMVEEARANYKPSKTVKPS